MAFPEIVQKERCYSIVRTSEYYGTCSMYISRDLLSCSEKNGLIDKGVIRSGGYSHYHQGYMFLIINLDKLNVMKAILRLRNAEEYPYHPVGKTMISVDDKQVH